MHAPQLQGGAEKVVGNGMSRMLGLNGILTSKQRISREGEGNETMTENRAVSVPVREGGEGDPLERV